MNFTKTSGLRFPGDILNDAKNICETDLDIRIRTVKYLGNYQAKSALKWYESQIVIKKISAFYGLTPLQYYSVGRICVADYNLKRLSFYLE